VKRAVLLLLAIWVFGGTAFYLGVTAWHLATDGKPKFDRASAVICVTVKEDWHRFAGAFERFVFANGFELRSGVNSDRTFNGDYYRKDAVYLDVRMPLPGGFAIVIFDRKVTGAWEGLRKSIIEMVEHDFGGEWSEKLDQYGNCVGFPY
jgi:hypothetical protein